MASATTATARDPHAESPPPYRGRFAPSPTGLLHLGSLFTAVCSYLRARERLGQWFVRIEDIDPPRQVTGAADGILRQLEQAGLHWDGVVVRQSDRMEIYREAALQLQERGIAYACSCSRRAIARHPDSGPQGTRYPGTCRDRPAAARTPAALRVRSPAAPIVIEDVLQSEESIDIQATTGDFVIWRRDNLPAYHLAVVMDDAWQNITEVMRGYDLFTASAPQKHLQGVLSASTPAYAHLPILIDDFGKKLSKQTHARSLGREDMSEAVSRCLGWLGWTVPRDLVGAPPEELLSAGAGSVDWKGLRGRQVLSTAGAH